MTKKDILIIVTYASLILGAIWFTYAFLQERKMKAFRENGRPFKAIITNGRVSAGTKNSRSFYLSFASLDQAVWSYKGEIKVTQKIYDKLQNGSEVNVLYNADADDKFLFEIMTMSEYIPPLKRSMYGLILLGIGMVCFVINRFFYKGK